MKLYTIIGGVNGCGKSSLTGALKAERSDLGTVLDGDRPSTIDECLEKGISFTQETTLSGARTERTIRRAKDLGYTIRLYYIGLDTVEMNGDGFTALIQEGDTVRAGQPLIRFDMDKIRAAGHPTVTMMVVTDDAGQNVTFSSGITATAGQTEIARY